jgi:hypothetical protein
MSDQYSDEHPIANTPDIIGATKVAQFEVYRDGQKFLYTRFAAGYVRKNYHAEIIHGFVKEFELPFDIGFIAKTGRAHETIYPYGEADGIKWEAVGMGIAFIDDGYVTLQEKSADYGMTPNTKHAQETNELLQAHDIDIIIEVEG